ncbi:uncharacterized protein FFB20_14081 [Fusarium fujikuroi]|uniref:Rhodopsin domain-containing protein n=1 Tax=Gibberella fujikuroi (strain CBS 195.34 / IMI 58289 / NRRL A-6831) TaxID=1279085 RepID=S0E1I2_GIBF5|nr:uncharacterized protein FFUJ_07427 [Fusarium fujikuroi IMI 58289]SCN78566.1 uncharacterized protein FFC1_02984 [Fusarium fujikuroi]CCT68626.1 uncharacterized protein FFUJ_07427 [Fusarium fujikuroi IMI 58289]SCN85597.1 uncharacterized protein FFE2_05727 [Fusarium fujikuroi]SCN91847.1 uncharacterized protein FFM5_05174 [Fusarium fujikuroi]SCO12838.1 uncharacterized protein FFB20_14081 [Fusarium fujikuroi]
MSCSFALISDIINRKLGRSRPSEYDDDEKTRAISITTTITITTTATDSIGDGNGQSVFDLNVALMVITNILMILRLYVRGIMARNLGWDDGLAVVAWGLVVAFSCIEIVLLTKGVGYQIQDVPRETLLQLLSLFPVDKLVFILAGGFARLSILAYLPRISRERSFMTCVYGVFVATIITAVTSFLFVLLSCSPVSDVFNAANPDRQCVSKHSLSRMRWAHSIMSTILNVVILSLCIWVSASTTKTRAQVTKMTLMLLLGLFAVVSTITRLILLLATNMNADITYNSLRVAPFFPLEINSGLWCSCLPAFQPLFEWTNNRCYNHYNMRKLSRSSAQEPLNDSWHRDYMTANPQVSIHGQPRDLRGKRAASDAESATGFAMLENERGIKLTTEFSVHVEDRVYTGDGSEDIVSRTPAWNAF